MKSMFLLLFVVLGTTDAAFTSFSRLNIPTNITSGGKVWALLVAGSNTYENYRHQADVCHAYQILHDHGIPDENIIVMMYDDIAYNRENPNQGTIINKPDGPNVYKNVLKDYTGKEVTPENFLNILQGNKAAMSGIGSGKVIESTENDYVFVNMVDHGAVGIFAFPDFVMLHKDDMQKALQSMYQKKKYKQMVIYMEACESGSMFDSLPTDLNIYVTTAANARESSYACYFDSHLETYLGDVYSIKWMENVDQVGTLTESLEQQFKLVKEKTTTSHVSQYGQLSFDEEKLKFFMGENKVPPQSPGKGCDDKDSVPSYDVPIATLTRRIAETEDEQERDLLEIRLMKELEARQEIRSILERVAISVTADVDGGVKKAFGPPLQLTQSACRRSTYDKFFSTCAKVDYAIKHAYVLSNLCEMGILQEDILKALDEVC